MTIKGFFLLLLLSCPVFAQNRENALDAKFCDILKNPGAYAGKLIRVRAIYRYGFEWADLYCSDCKGLIRVSFDEAFIENSKKKYRKKLKSSSDMGRTVNVVFVGKFYYSDGNEFIVTKIEDAKIIYYDSRSADDLPQKVRAKTYCEKH